MYGKNIINKKKNDNIKIINVAVICDDITLGGWSSLVLTLTHLSKLKIRPIVICLFGEGFYSDYLKTNGIGVYCIYLTKKNLLFKIFKLRSILKKEKIDIVHSNLTYSHILSYFATLFSKINLRVMQFHALEHHSSKLRMFLKRSLIKKADTLIFVSKAVSKSLEKLSFGGKNDKIVIHNGIELASFKERYKKSTLTKNDLALQEDDIVVLSVGNLCKEKGYESLINAGKLLNKNSHLKFLIAGYGAEKEHLLKIINNANLADKIKFIGPRTDVPELLAIADIFLLPSVSEGFGIAVLEAMAVGLPVITTNIGGLAELTQNGECALLVEPNKPQSIVDAIKKTLENKALFASKKKAGIKRAEEFDIKELALQFEDLYCKLYKKIDLGIKND